MLLIKTVALLCSATAAMAANAIASGAIFDGHDTTDYSASAIDIFKNADNHAAAAASILVYSATTADFSPATQEPKSLIQNLDAFISKVNTFPGFIVEAVKEASLALNGSLIQFEEIIREELDEPLTARGLRDLIPGYIEDQSLTDWILHLIVLSKPKDSNEVTFNLVRVTLTIHSNEAQTAYIPEQNAKIIFARLKVIPSFLSVYAEKLSDTISIVNVHSFIDYFATPKIPSQDEEIQNGATLCSQSSQISKNRQTVMSWFL